MLAHRFIAVAPGLMENDRTVFGRNLRERFGEHVVQNLSAQTSAENEEAERPEAACEAHRNGDVASGREDEVGLDFLEQRTALPDRLQHLDAALDGACEPLAAHALEVERMEFNAPAPDEAALHARRRADPDDFPAARLHYARHGKAGHHMPARAGCGDNENALFICILFRRHT